MQTNVLSQCSNPYRLQWSQSFIRRKVPESGKEQVDGLLDFSLADVMLKLKEMKNQDTSQRRRE